VPTVIEVLSLAVQNHQAGNLEVAERLYGQIIQADQGNADAHHLLGVLEYQKGRFDLAIVSMRHAIGLNPRAAQYHTNLGLAHEALGQIGEAAAAYQQAVTIQPDAADAHNNLGNILLQQGRLNDAAAHCRHALRYRPEFPEAYNNLGNALLESGQRQEAIVCFQQALRINPHFAKACNNLGNALKHENRLEEAIRCYQEAVRLNPQYAEAFYNGGIAFEQLDKLEEAIACYRQALQINPNFVEACNNLGTALTKLKKIEEGIGYLRQALSMKPNFAEACNNLGTALEQQQRHEEAVSYYRQAIKHKPDFAAAIDNLSNAFLAQSITLLEQGQCAEAEAKCREILRLKPDFAEAHEVLGSALVDQGKSDAGLECYREAVKLKWDLAGAHGNLAIQLAERGLMEEAETHLRQAIELEGNERLQVLSATLLPPIYQSVEDLETWRQRFTKNVEKLTEDNVTILSNQLAVPPFLLAYQGMNDRDLHRQIAKLYAAPFAVPGYTHAAGKREPGKVRVAFISRCFKNHTIGQLMRGLIAKLSRESFAVTVLSVGNHDDGLARWIREHADEYVQLPSNLAVARRLIAQRKLDVLIYTDIGMEPVTYSLACTRLAPVQCALWGHPVTTGIDTIDYFISSEDLETADSEQHYTEKLVRLKNPAIYYYRPVPPSPLEGRGSFGLPEVGSLYGCPQSLFKFHPEFDDILGGILRGDPQGTLVLLEGKHRQWDDALRQRLASSIPDVAERIRFVPQQDHRRFLNLNAVVDVLLDPIHFGGGNTSYEGLALGVPIVTMPSSLLRGRITYMLFRQLGVLDCVVSSPEEYVERAVRLGTDVDYRVAIADKIKAANEVLFENAAGVRELEEFLLQARKGRE
jgi:protein O-GlcNAc transferase